MARGAINCDNIVCRGSDTLPAEWREIPDNCGASTRVEPVSVGAIDLASGCAD
jgi:hypothetical protein